MVAKAGVNLAFAWLFLAFLAFLAFYDLGEERLRIPMRDDLSTLLDCWRPPESLSPYSGFQRSVWRRIAYLQPEEGASPWSSPWLFSIWKWLVSPPPGLAAAFLLVSMAVGGFVGSVEARDLGEREYLRSLDPVHASAYSVHILKS